MLVLTNIFMSYACQAIPKIFPFEPRQRQLIAYA